MVRRADSPRATSLDGIGLIAAMPAARFAEIRQVDFVVISAGTLPDWL
jgi:hypothetical protein